MKKLSLVLAIILSMSLVLTACSSPGSDGSTNSEATNGGSSDGEEIVLTYLTCQVGADASAVPVQNIVDEFNELHKGEIRVEIDGIPEYTNTVAKMKTNIAAGIPVDIWYCADLVTRDDYWGAGQFADLSPYIDDEMWAQDSEGDWAECTTIDGQVVGVPDVMMAEAIYYNKTMFADAGIDEASLPFETWEEFYEACDKLEAAGYIPLSQQTGGGNAWCTQTFYAAYVAGAGGPDVFKGIKEFDEPYFVDAAEMLLKLRDYTTEDALNGGYEAAANNFIQGRTAMIANGPWMIAQLKDNPELYENLGLLPFPSVDGSGTIVTVGPISKMMTSKSNEQDPERMEAIVEFMKFHNSPENVKDLILEGGVMHTVSGLDLSEDNTLEPLEKEYYRLIDESIYTVNEISNAIVAELPAAFVEETAKLWMEETTPEEFVENLEQKCFGN